jgi:hypothetical protein
VVRERPAGRRSPAIGDRLEILRPITKQHCAIEFRVAADVIVVPRIERLPGAVEPGLLRPENAALENGPRVARFFAVLQPLAALYDENPGAGRRKPRRKRRPTHS